MMVGGRQLAAVGDGGCSAGAGGDHGAHGAAGRMNSRTVSILASWLWPGSVEIRSTGRSVLSSHRRCCASSAARYSTGILSSPARPRFAMRPAEVETPVVR